MSCNENKIHNTEKKEGLFKNNKYISKIYNLIKYVLIISVIIIINIIIFLAILGILQYIHKDDESSLNYKQYSLVTDATELVQMPLIKIRALLITKDNDDYIFKVMYTTPENNKKNIKEIQISKNTMIDYFGLDSFFQDPNFNKVIVTNCKNIENKFNKIININSCSVDYWIVLTNKDGKTLNYSTEMIQNDIMSLFNFYFIKLNSLGIYQNEKNWYVFSDKPINNPKKEEMTNIENNALPNLENNNYNIKKLPPLPENLNKVNEIIPIEVKEGKFYGIETEEFQKTAPKELKELIKKDQEKEKEETEKNKK